MKIEDVKVGMKVRLIADKYLNGCEEGIFVKHKKGDILTVEDASIHWGQVKLKESEYFVEASMIEEATEAPVQVLNEDMKEFKYLTDEQKLLIIDGITKANSAEIFRGGEWEGTLGFKYIHLEGIYRVAHDVLTPLDVPWEHIKEEYKWAAMDEIGQVCLYTSEPTKGECMWSNKEMSYLIVSDILNILTNGIIWDKSLTKRPDNI